MSLYELYPSSPVSRTALPMPTFQYEPLAQKDIRLLSLHPGEFTDDIRCDMVTLDLDSNPRYRAISYTWGDETPLYEITINSCSFFVRSNCLYALQQARSFSEKGALLWIDAICINQDNIKERGHQVSLMGELYRRALQVFSCIGKVDETQADKNINILIHQSENFERLWKDSEGTNTCERCVNSMFHNFEKRTCHVVHLWLATITADDLYDLYDATEILSRSPYWTRLWIIQEVMLQKDVRVLYGLKVIWFQFLLALSMVKQHINANDPVLKAAAIEYGLIDPKRQQILRLAKGRKLFEMCLYRYLGRTDDITRMDVTSRGCADPRDRIYALLHIQQWPKSTGPPKPSYFKTRLGIVFDYFRHRGLGPAWFDEVGELLDLLGIPDEDCWREVTALLYANDANHSLVKRRHKPLSDGYMCE